MSKEELFKVFSCMFPEWGKMATRYKKIGSCVLAIWFVDPETGKEGSRVFFYRNRNNWQFGTKLWRKRPERKGKGASDEL